MALNIIGYQILEGTFNGHVYRNLKLHCLKELDKNISGQGVESVSIKMANCSDLLKACQGNFDSLIGREADVYYDQYRKPFKVDLK